jgi:hypothetical protein
MSFWGVFFKKLKTLQLTIKILIGNIVYNSKFFIFLAFDSTGTKWVLVILKSYLLYFDTVIFLSLGFIVDLRDQIVD